MDRIGPGAVPPLPGGEIQVNCRFVERPKSHLGEGDAGRLVIPEDDHTTQNLVHTSGEQLQTVAGTRLIPGLAEEATVDGNVGIDTDDEASLHGTRTRLAPCVFEHDLGGIALAELVDVGDDRLEINPELLEDLAPARRGRREDQSPNQIPISRSADSSESEPWTRL